MSIDPLRGAATTEEIIMSGTKDQNPGQQQSKAADAVEDVMGSARAEEAYLGHPLPHSDKIENRLEKCVPPSRRPTS